MFGQNWNIGLARKNSSHQNVGVVFRKQWLKKIGAKFLQGFLCLIFLIVTDLDFKHFQLVAQGINSIS